MSQIGVITVIFAESETANYQHSDNPVQHAGIGGGSLEIDVSSLQLETPIAGIVSGLQIEPLYGFNLNQDSRMVIEALDGDGNLVLDTSTGRILQRRPVAYQERGGVRSPVRAGYVVEGGSRARFALGEYDRALPLTIDPVLSYSSYLGGALDDSGLAVAVDAAGNTYLAGQTDSLDFPVTPGAARQYLNRGTSCWARWRGYRSTARS
jgi:hypothetical protein